MTKQGKTVKTDTETYDDAKGTRMAKSKKVKTGKKLGHNPKQKSPGPRAKKHY